MSTESILLLAASTLLLALVIVLVLFYIDPIKERLKQEQRKREIFEDAFLSTCQVDKDGNILDSSILDGYTPYSDHCR
jgi:hypothetical protein